MGEQRWTEVVLLFWHLLKWSEILKSLGRQLLSFSLTRIQTVTPTSFPNSPLICFLTYTRGLITPASQGGGGESYTTYTSASQSGVPGPATPGITCLLIRNANLWAPPLTQKGVTAPSHLWFNKPSRWVWCILKVRNHWQMKSLDICLAPKCLLFTYSFRFISHLKESQLSCRIIYRPLTWQRGTGAGDLGEDPAP